MELKTSDGTTFLVDEADLEIVNQYSWRLTSDKRYLRTDVRDSNGKRKIALLHRILFNPPDDMMVDHINGNGLDNRRSNVRFATNQQNQYNKRANEGRKYKGVFAVTKKTKNPWFAQVRFNKKNHYLGTFATQEEAARAYDKKALELFGEFAKTNF